MIFLLIVLNLVILGLCVSTIYALSGRVSELEDTIKQIVWRSLNLPVDPTAKEQLLLKKAKEPKTVKARIKPKKDHIWMQ